MLGLAQSQLFCEFCPVSFSKHSYQIQNLCEHDYAYFWAMLLDVGTTYSNSKSTFVKIVWILRQLLSINTYLLPKLESNLHPWSVI